MSDTYIEEYHARYFFRTMTSFRNRFRQKAIRYQHHLPVWEYQTYSYPSQDEGSHANSDPSQIQVGEAWLAETARFQTTCTVPKQCDGMALYLYFENDGENLLYVNGEILSGLNPGRCVSRLSNAATAGTSYDLLVESCLRIHNLSNANRCGVDYHPHLFKHAYLFTEYHELSHILDQIDVLFEIYEQTKNKACRTLLDQIRLLLKPDENIEEILKVLPEVQERLDQYFIPDTGYKHRKIFAIGNSHLDVSYLWPIRETVRKCARTFANAVHLLDQYPEFRYVHSQTVLLEWTKKYYPNLYEKVKEKIKGGQIDLVAGMYVESDTNIPSAESLIRQFQYGKSFCLQEFGQVSDICWLPDTFGYSAVLPQVVKKCGLNYFYTAKITKNKTNRFPHNVFRWEGLDGSSIVALIDTFCDYASDVNVNQIQTGLDRYLNDREMSDVMYLYGHGDGGGGPTKEMITAIQTLHKRPDWPTMEFETPSNYFSALGQQQEQLPVWKGEIYFEWHQGVYTSMGTLKKLNRRFEIMMRDTEIIGMLAGNIQNDQVVLDDCWKKALFNQFHDIITGTTVEESLGIAIKNDQESLETLQKLRTSYLQRLLPSKPDGNLVVAWNTLSFRRSDWISLPIKESVSGVRDPETGEAQAFYQSGERLHVLARDIPAMGYRVFALERGTPVEAVSQTMLQEEPGCFMVDTGVIQVWIDKETAMMTRCVFKEQNREVLDGVGNKFELYSEIYEHYCAWNIEKETLSQTPQSPTLIRLEVIENNAYALTVQAQYRISHSYIDQKITFYQGSGEVHFDTKIDWREICQLLKVSFETSVRANHATYDLSYGTVERPTHNNTSWEQAQIEVCAHQFVSLSEPSFGVSLLNDSKYGHDVKGKKIRLTLLKAPQHPMKEADTGIHEFTYVFFPHPDDFRKAQVDKRAKCLNTPLLLERLEHCPGTTQHSYLPLVGGDDGIYLGAMVPMPDGFLLRVYENHGNCAQCTLDLSQLGVSSVTPCWMTGEADGSDPVTLPDGILTIDCSPYEIKTYFCKQAN